MNVDTCKIINLPKISDPRGNLTFVEGQRHIPFDIARVYYLYDVPGGSERGGHAHSTPLIGQSKAKSDNAIVEGPACAISDNAI